MIFSISDWQKEKKKQEKVLQIFKQNLNIFSNIRAFHCVGFEHILHLPKGNLTSYKGYIKVEKQSYHTKATENFFFSLRFKILQEFC